MTWTMNERKRKKKARRFIRLLAEIGGRLIEKKKERKKRGKKEKRRREKKGERKEGNLHKEGCLDKTRSNNSIQGMPPKRGPGAKEQLQIS